ncbi:Protein LURP-one-related 8 [Vitis vinifera]|uniref:Protein LURP-one-related 8 n=1 Tax=Vitis vinifera TaxID=29760 RepID=A0A438HZ76_VITVI|nr:Protein LURP-one-related 8 [Vitis vinifera]
MTKVYPNATAASSGSEGVKLCIGGGDPAVLTVWKKSLLFNCSGFTVFDGKGNLVFRVDNYVAGNKGEIVLMDASGKPLLTIRRKRLSLGDNWLVYDGETAANPRFRMRKHLNLLSSKSLARVSGGSSSSMRKAMYEIEGSYSQRCCAVYDERRRCVAEIKRKEAVAGVALGVDVFRLIVQPEMDTPVAMALVILLDQMFR